MQNHLVLFITCLIFSVTANAQNILNFGLREKQDPSQLPKSRTQLISPAPVGKSAAITVLKPNRPGEWIITGGWEMAEASKLVTIQQSLFSEQFNTANWYNAVVPGTILTTLVDQGVYPDPYYGLNNLAIPDSLCRTDWWYRVAFDFPEKNQSRVWLLFNGINYKADIWLNGKLMGSIAGAFKRGVFDISENVQPSHNVLAVHVFPPPNPGISHEESPLSGPGPNGGQLCLDGPTFISSEGWDWVPGIRDRNMGIWQDVRILTTGDITISDPQVITDLPLPDTSVANLTVRMNLTNHSQSKRTVIVTGSFDNVVFNQKISLNPEEKRNIEFSPADYQELRLIHPRLWWPNGIGRPGLYKLNLSVKDEQNQISDLTSLRFGVRELTYELSVDTRQTQERRIEFIPLMAAGKPVFDNEKRRDVGDGVAVPMLREDYMPNAVRFIPQNQMGPYLVIKVNGVPVFCKGGNWGMDDGMKRVTRERIEPYFRLHRDAGFNMIRNWTGESTEELFYELADEYGLLVWNDFWLSTEGYNLDVNDNKLFMDNAEDVVKRFRNHPSIAIWCPRNEGYAPPLLEEKLARLIAREDGTRHYQPNSRYLNLRPSGPWHYFTDPAEYFRTNAHGFNTEQGTPSIPTAASMRKMMADEDVWPISDVWYYHDLHNGQKEYIQAINNLYGPSDNLEAFCRRAQMVNYDSHRAMFEAWNSRMWDNTSGLLLWMTHPAWPSTVWQVYSWDYETFGSYFGSKKACEPVHIQMNLHNKEIVVINATRKNIENAVVRFSCYDLSGHEICSQEEEVTLASNSLTRCFVPELLPIMPEPYLVRLELKDARTRLISENEYWEKGKLADYSALNRLEKVTPVMGKIKREGDLRWSVWIKNSSKVPAIAIKLNAKNAETGEIILPSYFSDGYFNLLPGDSRKIYVNLTKEPEGEIEIAVDGYNIQ